MTILNFAHSTANEKSWFRKLILWAKEWKASLLILLKEGKRIILEEPVTRYISYITSIIASLIVFEMIYDSFYSVKYNWMPFLSPADKQLAREFVEWFGVLYGFLLPQILVRVWEQFDEIDKTFDGEADAIKILAEDMSLMLDNISESRTKILKKLLEYSKHVQKHHAEEIKFAEFIDSGETRKDTGTKYLREIRDLYKDIIHPNDSAQQEVIPLVSELLHGLNTIIDLRGDRISLSSERLYETLKLLATITSIVWLVPFYFLYYPDSSLGIFGWLLVIAVTFLVIMILTIIDDLDNPFDGLWKININSWNKLIADIEEMLRTKKSFNNLQLHYFSIRVRLDKSRKLGRQSKITQPYRLSTQIRNRARLTPPDG